MKAFQVKNLQVWLEHGAFLSECTLPREIGLTISPWVTGWQRCGQHG